MTTAPLRQRSNGRVVGGARRRAGDQLSLGSLMPPAPAPARERVAPAVAPPAPARPVAAPGATLDDVLTGAWRELQGHRAAACPVCHAHMTPVASADGGVESARCSGCATTLS